MCVVHRENGEAWNAMPYEWKSAAVTVAGVNGEVSLKAQTGFTTLFDTVKRAYHLKIESTGTAYIRLNAATNDIITVTATTPFEDHYGIVDKLFVSTNGAAVTLTVKLR